METKDTIAAIATGMTNAGIGIIRISGEDAIPVADRIFCAQNHKKLETLEGYRASFGEIRDGDRALDETIALVMRGPKSYTGEDVVELQCHGGAVVLREVLSLVLSAGARPADPGEFTKRAFLNGRMDLAQAESVMDLIQSKNTLALKSSVAQLKGELSKPIRKMRETLIHELARIESALDDPEHYDLTGYDETLLPMLDEISGGIEKLLSTAEEGRRIREGIQTVVIGKPNVGKSSVWNRMLGVDRAIVTDIPGTTRDTLEEDLTIHGIPLHMVDTAGIHDASDLVEQIGIDKAKTMMKDADLILFVMDASKGPEAEDREILSMSGGQKCIVLINKIDLDNPVDKSWIERELSVPWVEISAKTGEGFDTFYHLLEEMFFAGGIDMNDQVILTNLRHKDLLLRAGESLGRAKESILAGMPEDFWTIDLTDAYTALGLILGETPEDDLAEEIFAKFCMGK